MKTSKNGSKILVAAALVLAAAMSFGQGGGGRGQGRGGFANNNSLTRILMRSDVQADLGLSDDAKTKIEALRPQRGQGGGGGRRGGGAGGGGGTPPTPEELAKRQADERAKVAEILTPDQMKRLDEIRIQISGDRAIMMESVQTALGFSDAQTAKVKDLSEKFQEASRSLFEKMRSGEIDRDGLTEKMTANNKVLGEELHKVLTPTQIEKLKTLGGKPFKADPPSGL